MPTVTLVRHRVGAVEDFELDRFHVVELEGRPVGIVRTEQGFFAIRNRCPHQAADICAGRVSGTFEASAPGEFRYQDDTLVVTCPWHRWEFELATGASYGRVTAKKLVTYHVEVEDGQVYVLMRGRKGA